MWDYVFVVAACRYDVEDKRQDRSSSLLQAKRDRNSPSLRTWSWLRSILFLGRLQHDEMQTKKQVVADSKRRLYRGFYTITRNDVLSASAVGGHDP